MNALHLGVINGVYACVCARRLARAWRRLTVRKVTARQFDAPNDIHLCAIPRALFGFAYLHFAIFTSGLFYSIKANCQKGTLQILTTYSTRQIIGEKDGEGRESEGEGERDMAIIQRH